MTSETMGNGHKAPCFLRRKKDLEQSKGPAQNRESYPNAPRPVALEKIPHSDAVESVQEELNRWDRYCALAIKVDATSTAKITEPLDKALMKLIDAAREIHGAVGCRWKEGLYFCAFPDIDITTAQKFAEDLNDSLASQRPETISMGIAPFPLLAYDKYQSWTNTLKALDHAAFFGPASIIALDAVTLNISGDKHYQAGEIEKAMAEYNEALELDPNDTNVRNSLGVCFADINDFAAAKESFTIVTQIDPSDPMAWFNMCQICLMENNTEDAKTFLEKAFAHNTNYYEIPFQLSQIHFQNGQWEKALAYAEKAIELRQDHWMLYSLKGQCLDAMDKAPEAIAAYTRSIKLNPYNAETLSALGCLYDSQNENPDICKLFMEQSVVLSPDNGLFHHRLGRWYQKHEHFEEAMVSFQRAIELGHDSTKCLETVAPKIQNEIQSTSRRAG